MRVEKFAEEQGVLLSANREGLQRHREAYPHVSELAS
jgi:hypothetical protein